MASFLDEDGAMPIEIGRGAQQWIVDQGTTPPERLRQRVLNYPRDRLLREIARRNASGWNHWLSGASPEDRMWSLLGETYLSEVAGIALEGGTNARRARVTDQVLSDLANMCHRIGPDSGQLSREWALKHGSSLIQKQYAFQEKDVLHPLMRGLCLFGDDSRFGDPVVPSSWWRETLRVPLPLFMEIAASMFLLAIGTGGAVPRDWLEEWACFKGCRDTLQAVDRWLSRPIKSLVDACRRGGSGQELLFEWPFILMGGDYVCPSPGAAIRRGGVGLYFLAGKALAADQVAFQAFTSALGDRFQRYVGWHLRHLDATLYPAIPYGSSQESVDFIIETPEVLVLVEAKSLAPLRATRVGEFQGSREHGELKEACKQIKRTSRLIRDGHPKFPKLRGRPLRGLVVTRERFVNLVWPWESRLVRPLHIPTAVLAVEQLEWYLPALDRAPSCGQALLDGLPSSRDEIMPDLLGLPTTTSPFLRTVFTEWADEVGWEQEGR